MCNSFKDFNQKLQQRFAEMKEQSKCLFQVNLDKDELWSTYLNAFPAGTNPIFRERTEHDCSCCRHFIKSIGNVVAIIDNKMVTLWDFDTDSTTYQPVVDALNTYVLAHTISDVFVTKEHRVGVAQNIEHTGSSSPDIIWNHFFLDMPNSIIYKGYGTLDTIRGEYRATKDVFLRSLREISLDAVDTVLELIAQNSLVRGEEWQHALTQFKAHKVPFDALDEETQVLYAWSQAIEVGKVIGRIRNHSIGTLLTDITNGRDLVEAVRAFEYMVAGPNYKNPKPIYTKKMQEEAVAKIVEMGYKESLPRRFARLDDITVNNILFANRNLGGRIEGVDAIFEKMAQKAVSKPKVFDHVEEVSAETFLEKILPTAREVEVYLEAKHSKNFVSLIAPEIKDSKTMFKWNNNFGWSYNGNLTTSPIRDNVAKAGGSVTGELRFSIQWNDDEENRNDFDAHCTEPNGHEIYYGEKRDYMTGGNLDIDIITPDIGVPAVENITWPDRSRMLKGEYLFRVHNFTHRGYNSGFKAEIEFDGQIYTFEYPHNIAPDDYIDVARVYFDGTNFTLKSCLDNKAASKEIWGVHTNNFIPVSTIMYSPNYWDEQQGIGHKHVFFMLKDCKNPDTPNGFYNEFLNNELLEHKRFFAALGAEMKVAPTDDQLSGLGFAISQRGEIVVKVKGASERTVKVKF